MTAKHIFHATALALAFASTAANAHGGKPDAHKAFDPATVEETSFGHAGNPQKIARTIRVGMSDAMRFTPSDIKVKKGQTVKFVIGNGGQMLHEMAIGTVEGLKEHAELMRKFPEMEHSEAQMAHVKPGEAGEIIWQFSKAGEYVFACLIPGHFEAGMAGKVVVQ